MDQKLKNVVTFLQFYPYKRLGFQLREVEGKIKVDHYGDDRGFNSCRFKLLV